MVRTAAPVSPGRSVAYSSLSTASEEYRSVSVLSPAMPSTAHATGGNAWMKARSIG